MCELLAAEAPPCRPFERKFDGEGTRSRNSRAHLVVLALRIPRVAFLCREQIHAAVQKQVCNSAYDIQTYVRS